MSLVERLSHDEIAEIGAHKLKSMGYIATFSNMNSAVAGERPDALGIKSCGETFLIEAKISRNDFLADLKKPWRQPGYNALGHYRAYLTPRGMLSPDEIPYGWQLWEIHGKTKPIVKVIKGRVKQADPSGRTTWKAWVNVNCDDAEYNYFRDKVNMRSVLGLLATVISRMDADGVDTQKFASRNGQGFLRPKLQSSTTNQDR